MNNSQLVYEAIPLLEQLNSSQPTLTTPGVVTHLLHHTSTLQSRLLAPRKRFEVMAQANILYLFRQMESLFNQSEIKNLCFEMGIDDEELAGEGKGRRYGNSLRIASVAAACPILFVTWNPPGLTLPGRIRHQCPCLIRMGLKSNHACTWLW